MANLVNDPRALFGDQQLSMPDYLPLQTSMLSSKAPAQQQANEPQEPPTIPNGSLRDALLGKFDDPEIPSGIPNDQQQAQADTHRAIGMGFGSAVDSLQNTANILKPGAGNPHMGDANRQFGEMLAQRALGNAKERRAEALQNFQIKDAADQRHEKMFQMATALKQQADMRDPNSMLSKNAQETRARTLQMRIAATENPQIANQFLQELKTLPGATAEQLAAREKSDPSEKIIEFDTNAQIAADKLNEERAKESREGQRSKEQTSLGWASLSEQKREHDLQNIRSEQNKSKLQLNEDKKAEEDIANLRNAKAELDRHIQNLKSGTVNNDKAAVYGNEAVKFASSLGLPVQPNAPLQDMLTSIPLAQATAEKAVTGSSRYTPARWTQFAVQPGEGTKVSINKLTGGSRYLDELIKERMTQLHTNEQGAPTSQSAMAKSFPPNAIPNTAAEVQKHTQTGAPPTPGRVVPIKGGGKAQQQPDGSWKRIE